MNSFFTYFAFAFLNMFRRHAKSYYNNDAFTDDDASDFEEVNELEIAKSQYNDCNGCSKILTTNNSYKCKKCGIVSHRSNCNTWFNTVKKHHFCGGCVYEFKPKE